MLGGTETSYTYEAFGETWSSGIPSDNPYQFTGRENDGAGLYHYRSRYYSPGLKRFVSEDPIGFAGGDVNLQAYVLARPLTWTDPTGLTIFDAVGDAARGVGGAAVSVGTAAWNNRDIVGYGAAGVACVGTAGIGCGAAIAGATAISLQKQSSEGTLTPESGLITIATASLAGPAKLPLYIASGGRLAGGRVAFDAITAGLRARGFPGYAARGALTWPGTAATMLLASRKTDFDLGLFGGGPSGN